MYFADEFGQTPMNKNAPDKVTNSSAVDDHDGSAPVDRLTELRATEKSFVLRLLFGVLAGVILGGLSLVASVEAQVILLRRYERKLVGPNSEFGESPAVTWPRRKYRKALRMLVIPFILGGIAGMTFGANRIRRWCAGGLLLPIPILFGAVAYYSYTESGKPSVKRLAESQLDAREFRETGRFPTE